jgi:hypothetical protein
MDEGTYRRLLGLSADVIIEQRDESGYILSLPGPPHFMRCGTGVVWRYLGVVF